MDMLIGLFVIGAILALALAVFRTVLSFAFWLCFAGWLAIAAGVRNLVRMARRIFTKYPNRIIGVNKEL